MEMGVSKTIPTLKHVLIGTGIELLLCLKVKRIGVVEVNIS
jgi:hypothetical protein